MSDYKPTISPGLNTRVIDNNNAVILVTKSTPKLGVISPKVRAKFYLTEKIMPRRRTKNNRDIVSEQYCQALNTGRKRQATTCRIKADSHCMHS